MLNLVPNFDKELIPVKHILVKLSRPQKGQYEVDIDSLLKIYTFLSPICDPNDLFSSIHNAVSGIVHLSQPLDAVTLITNLFEKVNHVCIYVTECKCHSTVYLLFFFVDVLSKRKLFHQQSISCIKILHHDQPLN